MAIARMTKKSNKINAIDAPSDIAELQFYLKNLKGTKIADKGHYLNKMAPEKIPAEKSCMTYFA